MNYLGVMVYLSDLIIEEASKKHEDSIRKGWIKTISVHQWLTKMSFLSSSFHMRLVDFTVGSARAGVEW